MADDVNAVWDKTDIPHYGRKTFKDKVEKLLVKSKDILKIPHERRNAVQLSEIWGSLLDISVCPHRSKEICDCPQCTVPHPEYCVCPPEIRVPDSWKSFLWDQREGRDACLSTVDWQKVREERDRVEKLMTGMDREEVNQNKMKKQRIKEEEVFDLATDSELIDSQGDRLSGEDSETDDTDNDSDWEDVEESNDTVVGYNTLQLRTVTW